MTKKKLLQGMWRKVLIKYDTMTKMNCIIVRIKKYIVYKEKNWNFEKR